MIILFGLAKKVDYFFCFGELIIGLLEILFSL